ncbi:MAG: DUF4019 domain-containing protein, partial [bacterium]|nr:DUF4019 domain-containing protein [bacterium]
YAMKLTTLFLLVAITTSATQIVQAESPAMLLEKGIFAEETKGDVDAAIKIYKQISDNAQANRKYIAQAMYRLGVCYMKQKKNDDAIVAFRAVVKHYADQKLPVKRASEHLARLVPPAIGDTPRIVQTIPRTLANNVDPALAKMTVTFDREMKDGCWSWMQIDPKLFPKRMGKISYDARGLTCTMPVKLEAGKVYWVGVNRQPFMNFMSKTGSPSKPHVILFATRSADGKPTAIPADMIARAKAINSATQTPGQKASAHLANRAWYLWNQRKLEESEKLFRQAVEKDPKNSNAWNGLGWALQNQGKEGAADAFKKCSALDPRNSGALNGMGWIAKQAGKEDQAIMWWQRAVIANKHCTAALKGLTTTFMARGQYHKAAVCYAAWLKADPHNKKIKAEMDNALAKAKVALVETRKALAAAEKWLALLDRGEYAESWDESAELFRKTVVKKQWIATIKGVRTPLGKFESRAKLEADYRTSLPGAPDGEYVVITFKAAYANKKGAVETVTPMKDKDGKWRVSGYYIK